MFTLRYGKFSPHVGECTLPLRVQAVACTMCSEALWERYEPLRKRCASLRDVMERYRASLISASLFISRASGVLMLRNICLDHLCVCLSTVYCGKTADWIRMLFGVVSGVGQGMGVLDGGGDR